MFFFSSRRRHTSFDCDWSSDVCSSDLSTGMASATAMPTWDKGSATTTSAAACRTGWISAAVAAIRCCALTVVAGDLKIGRASCREGVDDGDVEVGVETNARERGTDGLPHYVDVFFFKQKTAYEL